jgi:tyrosine-protein kinase Etk/Wzc
MLYYGRMEVEIPGERSIIEGLLYYLSILLRYKWMIVVVTATAAVAVVIFSIITLILPTDENPLPNKYTANAVLLVQSEDSGLSALSSVLSTLGAPAPGGTTDYGEIGLQVLESRPFLDALIEEFAIAERYKITKNARTASREAILNRSEFSYSSSTGTLTISYTDVDPVFSSDIVNQMVAHLEEWFTLWGGSANKRQIDLLEAKIADVSAEITRLEGEVEALQKQHGVLAVEEIATTQTAMLTDLRTQQVQVEIEIKNYAQYSTIEDEALTRLKTRKQSLEQLIRDVERGYTGGKKTMPARSELPQLAIQFLRLQTDLEIQMRIYQSINEQYELMKLSAETGTVFDILEYAEVPDEKSGPSRGSLCITVTLAALIGSIVLAFIINLIKNVMTDPLKKNLLKGRMKSR